MQIKIVGASVAVGIPKTGFGLNAGTVAYIQIRSAPGSKPQTLALSDAFSVGGKSGTLIWSNVATRWASISPAKYGWVCSAPALAGKKINLGVKGTLIKSGTADIEMSLIGGNGEHKTLVSKMDVETSGFQITGLQVRGRLKLMPGAEELECRK